MDHEQFAAAQFWEAARLMEEIASGHVAAIARAASLIAGCLQQGHKVLVFGNGGSAADAQHLAGELVGRYRRERPALPAIALTTDSSVLTAIGNDYSFEDIFSRQVQALAQPGDVVIGISTSGRSPNVIAGLRAAQERGAIALALTGPDASQVKTLVDLAIQVPSLVTARIQEAHAVILHILCDLVDQIMLPPEDHPDQP